MFDNARNSSQRMCLFKMPVHEMVSLEICKLKAKSAIKWFLHTRRKVLSLTSAVISNQNIIKHRPHVCLVLTSTQVTLVSRSS